MTRETRETYEGCPKPRVKPESRRSRNQATFFLLLLIRKKNGRQGYFLLEKETRDMGIEKRVDSREPRWGQAAGK